MSGVKVTDHGAVAMLSRIRAMQRLKVKVGILDDAPKTVQPGQKPPKMTLPEIAALHEFGAGKIPQRSFIRSTVDEHQSEILDLQVKLGAQVIAGKIEPEVALERLGFKVVGWVQAKITSNIPPALTPGTLARKTVGGKVGNVALINTGQLRSSVVSHVVDG